MISFSSLAVGAGWLLGLSVLTLHHTRTHTHTHTHTPHYQWIKDLKMKSKLLTFSKLNIRKYLYHFEIGKNSYPKQRNETDEFKLHIKDTLNKVKL